MIGPLLIIAFIFGTIIGSFLNVVIARYNTGMTLGGRSRCFSCNRNLEWYELIPLLSFAVQTARCRKCKSAISWQYPLVELMTGVLFVLIVWYFPPLSLESSFLTLFYFLVTSLLIVIAAYDARHKIIPDPLVYTFAAISFAALFAFGAPTLWQMLAGPILALPFYLLWQLSGGKWMGLGDAKLMLGIGWILGIGAGISAIILSFWIGAIISVLWMWLSFKKLKARYEIPFGPYLILGMYLVLFWNIQVIDIQAFLELFS